jgi:hypothetical protein
MLFAALPPLDKPRLGLRYPPIQAAGDDPAVGKPAQRYDADGGSDGGRRSSIGRPAARDTNRDTIARPSTLA